MNKRSNKKPSPKAIKNLPRVMYAASINLSGLYAKKPIRCNLNVDYLDIDGPRWYSKCGNLCIDRRGLDMPNHVHYGEVCATFASVNRDEVELWLAGATSVMTLLRNWAHA